jgi:Hsp70 protein
MTDPLGLSIGTTNLVAARAGAPPVSRRAVLTLYPNRVPEVGVPSENPNLTEPGVVLSGFVERVGDPVPLVAPDGSKHLADRLLVEAVDAMARTVSGPPPSQVVIAVPAHWGPAVLGALRAILRTMPNLSPNGVPPTLVSDAVAALGALNTNPGLPHTGIVALLDFGGSATSITLADAARSSGADLAPIDETLRYTEFSGNQVDQALLTHVLADIDQASGAATAGVGALTVLSDRSRQAKERLSAQPTTVLTAELPGYHSDIRVTRAELENLISEPLTGVIGALEEMLRRNRIPAVSLSAVATAGGGAAIPLITQRLSAHFRVPVVTTPQPALTAAAGAALFAARGPGADVPTGLAPTAAREAATGVAAAGWAARAAGAAAAETAADGSASPASATFRALAWSQEQGGDEPVPYSGADYTDEPPPASAPPATEFAPPEAPLPEAPLPWYRRPQVLFAAALLAVLVLGTGLVWTLTSKSSPIRTGTSTVTSPAVTNPQTPGAPLTQTVTITGSNGSPTVVTPPPSSTAPSSDSNTTATTTLSSTTTTTTLSSTTTTTAPTTTTTQPPTTTTTQPPTTTATQPPTTTTQAPPTTTVKPPTSSAVAPPT